MDDMQVGMGSNWKQEKLERKRAKQWGNLSDTYTQIYIYEMGG